MPLDPQFAAAAQWAAGEFAAGLAAAIEGMAGTKPALAVEALASRPEPAAPLFTWRQALHGLPGDAFLLASESALLALGGHVMAAAGIEDASPDELKSTFRESLGQAFSVLGRAVTGRLQREVTPDSGSEAPIPAGELAWTAVQLTLGDTPATVNLGFASALLEALVPREKAVATAASAGPAAPVPAAASHPAPAAPESKTFDLLLDVELPVSVSFGHAYVPLKDLLKLTTGSIVELSRAVAEPVDIVVNNCVIAKGEVVVVEGNFGVRIQQVISRSERLRSLQ